jgi:tmRNA-binding protein
MPNIGMDVLLHFHTTLDMERGMRLSHFSSLTKTQIPNGGRKPRWYTEKLDKEKFHRKEAYALGQGVHGSSAVPVEVIRTSKRRKVKDEEEADERDDGIASIADMLRLNTAALSTMSTSLNNFIDHQQRQDKRMDLQSKEIHALYRKVAESNQAVVGDVKLLCKQGQLFYEALKDVRMKHDEEQQTKDLKAAQEKIKKLNQQLSNMLKFQQEPATALTRSVSEVIALNASQTTLTETGAVPAVEQGEDTREDVSKCDDIPTSR